MSLLERLRRDSPLRQEMQLLLRSLDSETQGGENRKNQLGMRGQGKRVTIATGMDQEMIDMPIQIGMIATEQAFFSKDKADQFKQYYGASPELVEGSKFFGNSEGQEFLRSITQTRNDVTKDQPILTNLPWVNVLLGDGEDRYKLRAVVDSGSTGTLISDSLQQNMPALQKILRPTSLGFWGVGNWRMQYEGILYDVQLQLGDRLVYTTNVAVFHKDKDVMLLDNDLIDGESSKFEVIDLNAKISAYVLSDQRGNTGLMHYLKNVERIGTLSKAAVATV